MKKIKSSIEEEIKNKWKTISKYKTITKKGNISWNKNKWSKKTKEFYQNQSRKPPLHTDLSVSGG